MKLSEFDYYLPEELIAQTPIEKRDESRLMVLDQETGDIKHEVFKNIINYLNPNDCLVLNETRVIPARIYGKKEGVVTPVGVNQTEIEMLLLKDFGDNKWEVLLKPGRKCPVGTRLIFGDNLLVAEVIEVLEDGNRIVKLEYSGVITIGKNLLPYFFERAFTGAHSYKKTYELTFEDGILLESKNTSGSYHGF